MEKLKDAPEWTCVQLDVKLPPNASSPPHRHGGANVFAFVAEGEITSAMNEGEAKVYKTGETWYEAPGCKSFQKSLQIVLWKELFVSRD